MASKATDGPPAYFLAIPVTDGVELDFTRAFPVSSQDEAKTAARSMAAGEGEPNVVIFQAVQVLGTVSKVDVLWNPRGG